MKWIQRGQTVAQQAPPFEMPELIWKILSARELSTREEIESLYQPKLKNLAHPFSISQMDVAVDRLITAFKNEEKILIYGDYDLDGTPAVALLLDGFKRLGFQNLVSFQPSRLKDGYGFHAHVVEEYKPRGVQLIVTVDVGITDCEAVNKANELGIDVIVTDHHLPKEELPAALAILNPNKGTCTSQLQHLCGTGVAFYLILALKMEMSRQQILAQDFNSKELLDLFALATITDMVPLIKENRILVKHGLIQLAQTQRPGLKRLLKELGFYNRVIHSQDVAFRIAPKLNALTRLDEQLRALDVLTATQNEADAIIDQVMRINEKRVEFQSQAKKIAAKLVKDLDKTSHIWLYSHEFHPGVISLVASDIMSEYGVPVFVGSLNAHGQIIGSARAPSSVYNLQDALNAASAPLMKWGGHKMAAGFEVSEQNAQDFSNLLKDFFEKKSDNVSSNIEVFYDAEAQLSDFSPNFMKWFEGLGPFGNSFETPKILLKNVTAANVRKLKNSFLKYTLETREGEIEAPWFKDAQEFPVGSQVDVLVTPQWNDFNGKKTIQCLIQGMRAH